MPSETFYCPYCQSLLTKSAQHYVMGETQNSYHINLGQMPANIICPACNGKIDTMKMIKGEYDKKNASKSGCASGFAVILIVALVITSAIIGKSQSGKRSEIENPYIKNNQPMENKISSQVGAALYWFNWEKISDAGEKLYGAYVYKHILQSLSPQNIGNDKITCIIRDGDFLSSTRLDPSISAGDRTIVEATRQGINKMYIIAVKGNNGFDYEKLNSELKKKAVIGYIGMVTMLPMDVKEFHRMGYSMALAFAIGIEGNYLEKIEFAFLSNQVLEEMGFRLTR